MFDDRVYKRGALTLHALRLTVGDATLVEILRAWTQTHAHGTVVTDDFVDVASRHTEEPLHELFRSWLFEQPLPALPGSRSWFAAARVTSLTGSRRAAEPVVVSGKSRRTRAFAAHAGR